ncbi:MAG: F0F1 ATP synthase subunit B [bacterium]|nr:F0F1 ATP synthase subunit B [bacterium]
MQINWFTVIAQIINFLILVWLLKRFLYQPILNAIETREEMIAAQLKDAETKMADAKNEQDGFRQKNENFDAQKKELMSKTLAETNELRDKLLDKARTDANLLRTKLETASQKDQEALNQKIAQKIEEEVFAVSRKTLAILASASLEELVVKAFIERLNALSDEEGVEVATAFKSADNAVFVRSAFDLPTNLQTDIQKTLDEVLGKSMQIEFKTAPQLISGIELSTNGYKLSWSISAYLNSFKKILAEPILEEETA